jgi:hypothetical protein
MRREVTDRFKSRLLRVRDEPALMRLIRDPPIEHHEEIMFSVSSYSCYDIMITSNSFTKD